MTLKQYWLGSLAVQASDLTAVDIYTMSFEVICDSLTLLVTVAISRLGIELLMCLT